MAPLDNFLSLYQDLQSGSVIDLGRVYTEDIVFRDPVTQHNGLPALHDYFHRLLLGNARCGFTVESAGVDGDFAHVQWLLSLRHPGLHSGEAIEVGGCSLLTLRDGKVCAQQDYFDLGALIYEHVPLLGFLLRKIRGRYFSS